jgi:hypothetical protein
MESVHTDFPERGLKMKYSSLEEYAKDLYEELEENG